jgi:hypothetical protein
VVNLICDWVVSLSVFSSKFEKDKGIKSESETIPDGKSKFTNLSTTEMEDLIEKNFSND